MQHKSLLKSIQNSSNDIYIDIVNEKNNAIGYLSPIMKQNLNNKEIIKLLTKWRNNSTKYFLTQFKATYNRTKSWLQKILNSNNTLLFLILTSEKKIIGQIGIYNINENDVEIGNLIRGEIGGDKNLIYFAEITLIKWIFNNLHIKSIYLYVFSNNIIPIMLHKKVGFVIIEKKDLYKKIINNEIILSYNDKSGEKVNFKYLKMQLISLFIKNNLKSKEIKK